jgi:hypothetical protein
MSYPGEWAILDGQNRLHGNSGNGTAVVGLAHSDKGGTTASIKYWKFERLEIKNGMSLDSTSAYGFYGVEGPFIFRYCYIHDNVTLKSIGSNNPGGIGGNVWNGCLVEYCCFANNGANVNNENCTNVIMFSDYNWIGIGKDGMPGTGYHVMNNEFRYNLFINSGTGLKYKAPQ